MSTLFTIDAQIDVRINKPPLVGMQAQTLNDLTTVGAQRPYQHKVVWVISERAYWYLTTGNGTDISHWAPISTSGILEYQKRPYERGAGVIHNGKVYIATQAVTQAEDPVNTPSKWLPISEVRFTRFDFVDAEEVVVISGYTHPTVQVFNENNELVSAFVSITNGRVAIDLFPKMTGYVIIKE